MLNNNSGDHQPIPDEDIDDKQPKAIKKNFGKIHTIYTSCVYKKPKPVRFIDSEISSSLTFQKLIYFNTFYSIIMFYAQLTTYIYRWQVFRQDTFDLLRLIFVFVPWGVVEIFRIQNGYTGNIKESFPEIVSFFLQTIFQIILNFFLVTFPKRLPIEGALITIQIIFNIIELFYCFIVIIKLQKAQSALFFWKSPYGKHKQQNKDDIQREYQETLQGLDSGYGNGLDESRFMESDNNFKGAFNATNYSNQKNIFDPYNRNNKNNPQYSEDEYDENDNLGGGPQMNKYNKR